MVIGGGMANTFLLAQGKAVGKSLAEPDRVEEARAIIASRRGQGRQARRCPSTWSIAKEVTRGADVQDDPRREGPGELAHRRRRQAEPRSIEEALADVKTVLWNGPLGVFEIPSFAHGTKAIARFLADRAEAGAKVVIGGGDSVAAITQQGLADKMTHISTGGGAVARVPRGSTSCRA